MTTENPITQTVEHSAGAMAAKSTYVGGAVAALGGLSASDIAAIGGLMLAAAGFAVNVYFRWRQDRRDAAEHVARMGQLGAYDD